MSVGTVPELKSALAKLLDENDRISGNAIKIEDNGGVVVDSEAAQAYRKNLADAQEIRGWIEAAESTDELKRFASEEPESKAVASAASEAKARAAGQGLAVYQDMPQSLAEMFTESEEFKALVKSGGGTMPSPWEIKGRDVTALYGWGRKDVYNSVGGTLQGGGLGPVQFDPMVPRSYRRARVRDLFPVAQTNSNLIDYFRVIGFGANRLDLSSSASVVPDRDAGNTNFGLKPHSSLKFETASAPVRTIAHYEVAHRNVIADVPQLQSTISNELLYGLRLTEDAQILNGTGTGEDLLGILNTPGIQTYAESAGPSTDTAADAIRRGATRAVLAYYDPTGVVIHPYDWEGIELQKGTDEHYAITANVAIGAEQRLWRMTVVDSPAIAQKTGLVGAFGLGAQLYDRMEASIRIAEQHSDFFVRNAVAILAEERLALAVKRPESFVKLTFQ